MNIIDFTQTDESSKWRIINDGVMGGVSKGSISSTGHCGLFTGYISLENNGGFSSTVRPIVPIKEKLTTFIIDVENQQPKVKKSELQVYQLRATMNVDGYRLAYKHDLALTSMNRTQLHLPLHAFEASFRGRVISNAPTLKSEAIIEMGLLVKSKSAGKFALHIHSVKLV